MLLNGQVATLASKPRKVLLAKWLTNLIGGNFSNYATLPSGQLYAKIAAYYGPKIEGDYISLPVSYAYHDIFVGVGGVDKNIYDWGESLALANIYAVLKGQGGNQGKIVAYRNLNRSILLALIVDETGTPPVAPTNLAITIFSDTRLDLSWDDNSSNESGYKIERSPDGISFTEIATVAANTIFYSDTGLAANTRYYYRVRAFNGAINSDYSNTADAFTFTSQASSFFTTTGVTNSTERTKINNLLKYVVDEGLVNSFRLYPKKASQNFGAGSIVQGVGGLTSNNGTLIGSPGWGGFGVGYNGSNQCMRIGDFLTNETLTIWVRVTQGNTGLTAGQAYVSQWDTGLNNRSFQFQQRNAASGHTVLLQRSGTGAGTGAVVESYDTAGNPTATTDRCYVVQWLNGGGRSLWINNSIESVSLTSGSSQTSRFNSSADIIFGALLASGSPTVFLQATGTALAFLAGPTPTDSQRETITNLINAL